MQTLEHSLSECKWVADLLQDNYRVMENFVPIDHEETISWLTWCGFTFDEQLYEINGHSMMRFVRCKNPKNNVYYLEKRPVMH